jgi:hypothetical protein
VPKDRKKCQAADPNSLFFLLTKKISSLEPPEKLNRQNAFSHRNRFKTKFPPDREPEPFDYGVLAERLLRLEDWLDELDKTVPAMSREDRDQAADALTMASDRLQASLKLLG